jgi:membrane protein implicated in regulation of membrane protease activity
MGYDMTTFWIILGIVLLIGEMLTGSFFMAFIAMGSFAAALVASLDQPFYLQALAGAILAIVGVMTLRKSIQRKFLKTIHLKADIGNEIVVDHEIAPHKQARITYQGTTWQATNLDHETLKQGDRVEIVGIDGNTLLIRKSH